MDIETIKRNFKTQNLTADQLNQVADIKCKARDLAETINKTCPESREKSLAFTKLEEASMWATAAISRN